MIHQIELAVMLLCNVSLGILVLYECYWQNKEMTKIHCQLDSLVCDIQKQLQKLESLAITCHKAAEVMKSHQESVEKLHNTVEAVKQGNKRTVR